MDLAVISVLKDEIDIDNHVVLISSMNRTSHAFWASLDTFDIKK